MAEKVLVGISGGVDSGVAAALLQRQGYEVYGATMVVYKTAQTRQMLADARVVCAHLSIPHETVDLTDRFDEVVVRNFMEEYRCGRTPNPCVQCNRHIKFGAFLEFALSRGMDYVATGHYARIRYDATRDIYDLCRPASVRKDQTYFLYGLNQHQLAHILFPLAEYEKEQVRSLAQTLNLPVSDKKDSQDVCFVDGAYADFLRASGLADTPGDFVLSDGTVVGRHRGIAHYTVGQRKGLGIAFEKPLFVIRIDAQSNTVVVGENSQLFTREVPLRDVHVPSGRKITEPVHVQAKLRSAAPLADAVLIVEGERGRLWFDKPQRAAAPGQAAVCYHQDAVLAGGTIYSSWEK